MVPNSDKRGGAAFEAAVFFANVEPGQGIVSAEIPTEHTGSAFRNVDPCNGWGSAPLSIKTDFAGT